MMATRFDQVLDELSALYPEARETTLLDLAFAEAIDPEPFVYRLLEEQGVDIREVMLYLPARSAFTHAGSRRRGCSLSMVTAPTPSLWWRATGTARRRSISSHGCPASRRCSVPTSAGPKCCAPDEMTKTRQSTLTRSRG